MTSPLFSIIIPAYGRIEPLKFTIQSAIDAVSELGPDMAEIIVVDDGSQPPLNRQLQDTSFPFTTFLSQPNSGSIVARATGLQRSRGCFILFLDSDDLIHPRKLVEHAQAHEEGADIVVSELADVQLKPNYKVADWAHIDGQKSPPNESLNFWLSYQPAPHAPTYRKTWLESALKQDRVPQVRTMDAAGDVWLYYNFLCAPPPRISALHRGLAATGPHPETRYSQHWENLSIAALLIAEHWVVTSSKLETPSEAIAAVGRNAFETWRRLPIDFAPEVCNRWLQIWRNTGEPAPTAAGRFQLMSKWLGPLSTARLLRSVRRNDYASCRTMDENSLQHALAKLRST